GRGSPEMWAVRPPRRAKKAPPPRGKEPGVGCDPADHEQDTLLVDEPPVDLADLKVRIPGVDRLAADAVDLNDREILAAPELLQRLEPKVETAVMEFAHAARDVVDPLVQQPRQINAAIPI